MSQVNSRAVKSLSCAGVILAGGQSRRMGEDKALLSFQGQLLLTHTHQRLTEAGLESVWVSGDYPSLPSIPDTTEHQGPLAGLLCVAKQLLGQAAFIVVVPVDMPMLPVLAIQAVMQQDESQLAVAYQQAFFPMRLALTPALVADISQLLSLPTRKSHSIRALLERLPSHWLPLPEHSELFCNVNTPAQWQQALLDSQQER